MLRYLTATEVAAMYRRPLGTIYRLASTDCWRRCDGRPTLYNAIDVDASMHRSRCPICWSPVDGNQCHLHRSTDADLSMCD